MRRLLILAGLLCMAAPAEAYEPCFIGGMSGTCPYDEVRALGGAADGRAHAPADVAAAQDGRIAVADGGARRAIVLRPDGSQALAVGGGNVWATAVAFAPDGSLHVAEDCSIHRYAMDGARLSTISAGLQDDNGCRRPRDLATDATGRVYAAVDRTVLVWAPDGTLERGIDFGEDVGSIAADGDGRLFVARNSNNSIQQIGPTNAVVRSFPGTAFTLAPDGKLLVVADAEIAAYDADGNPAGSVPRPAGFAGWGFAATGDRLYVADASADLIRVATRAGQALPPLGGDPGTGLNEPSGAAAAPDGRLWVVDHDDHRIAAFDAEGTFAGSLRDYGDDFPLAIAFAGDQLFVTTEKGKVKRLGLDGTVRAAWQISGGPFPTPSLSGIGVSPAGDVWVRDGTTLRRFSADGAPLSTLAVDYSNGHGMTVDAAGNLYVAADTGVVKLSPDGAVLARLKASLPEGIAVDPAGNVYVAGQRGVYLLAPDGRELMRWAEYETSAGRVHLPWDVTLDAQRHVFVVDRWGHQVMRFRMRESLPAPAPGPGPPIVTAAPVPGPVLSAARTVSTATAVRVRVTCAAGCSGTVRLRPAKGAGAYSPAVKVLLAPGASKKVTLKLTRSARRALKKKRRLKAAIVATATGTPGARRTVSLKYRR